MPVTVTKNSPAVLERDVERLPARDPRPDAWADARPGVEGGEASAGWEERLAAEHGRHEYQWLLARARSYLASADPLIPRDGPVKRPVTLQLRAYRQDLSVDQLDSGALSRARRITERRAGCRGLMIVKTQLTGLF